MAVFKKIGSRSGSDSKKQGKYNGLRCGVLSLTPLLFIDGTNNFLNKKGGAVSAACLSSKIN